MDAEATQWTSARRFQQHHDEIHGNDIEESMGCVLCCCEGTSDGNTTRILVLRLCPYYNDTSSRANRKMVVDVKELDGQDRLLPFLGWRNKDLGVVVAPNARLVSEDSQIVTPPQ